MPTATDVLHSLIRVAGQSMPLVSAQGHLIIAYDGDVLHRTRHDLVDGPVAEALTDLQARGQEVPDGNDLTAPISAGLVARGFATAVAAARERRTYIELPGIDPAKPIEPTIGIAGVVRYDDRRSGSLPEGVSYRLSLIHI
jgi:hypothetical protein